MNTSVIIALVSGISMGGVVGYQFGKFDGTLGALRKARTYLVEGMLDSIKDIKDYRMMFLAVADYLKLFVSKI